MNDPETATKAENSISTREAMSAATQRSSTFSPEAESFDLVILDEVCVEEVSIDGMCGVY